MRSLPRRRERETRGGPWTRPKGAAPVSVVVACYNCADTIGVAYASVVAQTWPPRELILVDDCSDDGTERELAACAELSPELVKVLRLPVNSGPAAARNAGWDVASQPYLAFLDADDAWAPEKLERQLPVMLRNPLVALSGHRMGTSRGERLILTDPATPRCGAPMTEAVTWRRLLIRNPFATSSVITRTSFEHRFDESFRHCEDYKLWLDLLGTGRSAVTLDEVLGWNHKKFFGSTGLSSNLVGMQVARMRVYRELRSQGRVSRMQSVLLRGWSALTFLRRLVTVSLARRRARVATTSRSSPGT